MANDRDVNILVRARDEASRVFRNIEAAARQMMGISKQQVDVARNRSEEFNLIRSIALVAKLNAAIGVTNVLTDVFKGNLDDAAESLKNMPMGIGSVVRQFEMLLGNVTGLTDETERLKYETDLINTLSEARSRTSKLMISYLDRQHDRIRAIRHEIQAISMAPLQLQLFIESGRAEDAQAMARQMAEAQIQAIRDGNRDVREALIAERQKLESELEGRQLTAGLQKHVERLEEIRNQILSLERFEAQRIQQIREAQAEEEAAIAERSAVRQAEIRRKASEAREILIKTSEQRIAALWTQAQEMQLRATEQHYEADLLALHQHHQQRLREIEKQAEKEAKLHPELAGDIRRLAAEEAAAAEELFRQQAARIDQADQQRRNLGQIRALEEMKRITDALNAEMIASAREQARMGNRAAEEELRRLQIQREFEMRRRQLQAILESEVASVQQKVEAQRLMIELSQQELESLENINRELERGYRLRGTGVTLSGSLSFASGSVIGPGGRAVHRDLLPGGGRFVPIPQQQQYQMQRSAETEQVASRMVDAHREGTKEITNAITQMNRRIESVEQLIRDIIRAPILNAEIG